MSTSITSKFDTWYEDPLYPSSDGEPMADNTLQWQWIVIIKEGLERVFKDDPNVFIAGDLLWYPVEGDPKTRIAPDALVAFGRPKGHRTSYLQWREGGIAPQVVFEVLSQKNTMKEMERKRNIYERYGVEEFYIYDPDNPRLVGYLRLEGRLQPIPEMNGWTSPRLGVRFELNGKLVLTGPDRMPFATFLELDRQRDAMQDERDEALERVEEQLRRAEQERRRADAEREHARIADQRAEAERQRADAERQRAERLAAKLRELGIEPEA
jgi:Uma2 family endonuclease